MLTVQLQSALQRWRLFGRHPKIFDIFVEGGGCIKFEDIRENEFYIKFRIYGEFGGPRGHYQVSLLFCSQEREGEKPVSAAQQLYRRSNGRLAEESSFSLRELFSEARLRIPNEREKFQA